MLPADRNLILFGQQNARHRRYFTKKIKSPSSGSTEHRPKQICKQKAQKKRQKKMQKPKSFPILKTKKWGTTKKLTQAVRSVQDLMQLQYGG